MALVQVKLRANGQVVMMEQSSFTPAMGEIIGTAPVQGGVAATPSTSPTTPASSPMGGTSMGNAPSWAGPGPYDENWLGSKLAGLENSADRDTVKTFYNAYKSKNEKTAEELKALLQSALGEDIAGKKTLSELKNKYIPQGMSQYDVLNQYNSTSPWGPAKETPEQLSSEMGFSGDVLKQIYPDKFTPETAAIKETKRKQEEAKKQALNTLETIENWYFGNKLHYGLTAKGIKEALAAKVNPNTNLAKYNRFINSKGVYLQKLAGDVGNIAWSEQQAQLRALASGLQDYDSAKDTFNLVREGFGLPTRDYSKISNNEWEIVQ